MSLLLGIIIGCIAMVILGVIPVLGPILAGMVAGIIAGKGAKRGATAGFFAGIIGGLGTILLLIYLGWTFGGPPTALVGGVLGLGLTLYCAFLGFIGGAIGGVIRRLSL